MEGRERVRQFLVGGEADRPPFLPLPMELAARLAQVRPAELMEDPHLMTQSLLETVAVCDFDSVALALPRESLTDPAGAGFPGNDLVLGVLHEAVHRLRAIWGDRVGMVVLLPGPGTWATSGDRWPSLTELEDVVARLLAALNFLQPPLLDGFGVLEEDTPDATVDDLSESLAAVWNLARYYAVPSVFVTAHGGTSAARTGADAVAVWDGVAPAELLGAGAQRVGVPLQMAGSASLPDLPEGGFFTTAGEIPATVEVERVQQLVAEVRLLPRADSRTR